MINHTAPEWVKDAVFYLIFVDRFANGDPTNDPSQVVPWDSAPARDNFFGGDFQGILDHLPYLQDLGVTALYLTPIFKARTNHRYDTCDYLCVDPSLGSEQLFRRLIDETHKSGIRVVLDAVFNHCGDGFWAFQDLQQKGIASRYQRWFYPTVLPIQQDPPNYQTCGGAAYLPKLRVANPEVQEYLLNVAMYWLKEFNIDGWRLDVPWKVDLNFWREFRKTVKRVNPEAYIVGEVWRDPEPWLEGDTCDGTMNYLLRNYILDYCVYDTMDAEDFDHATSRLRDAYAATAPYQLNLLGSHDTPRILTLCKNNVKRAILALTAQFTTSGAPLIYYGDEIGLAGENDPDCRKSMIWEETAWNKQIHAAYRLLIGARTSHPALRSGGFESLAVFNRIFCFNRYKDGDEVITILNPGEENLCPPISLPPRLMAHKNWRDIFSGKIITHKYGCLELGSIPSQAALVLVPDI